MQYVRYKANGKTAYGSLKGTTIWELSGSLFGKHKQTGKRLALSKAKLLAPVKPGKRVYDKNGLKMAFERPGMTFKRKGDLGPAWIEGKDIWVRGDTSLRGEPTEAGGKVFQVNDMSTYFGALKDVSDPKVSSAPAGQAFSDVNTWPDWLEMGAQPGNYYSRCFGRKTDHIDGMPKIWRDIMAMKYPAVMKDPAGALKG